MFCFSCNAENYSKQTLLEIKRKKIIEALNSAICEELGKGYWKVEASGNLNLINEKLGINWEKRFVNFEEINNYAKGWFTT